MFEIIKTYKQSIKPSRFIGKKYGDGDRVGGGFGAKWGEWFDNKWFEAIEKQIGGKAASNSICEDGDSYIGLMRDKHDEPFQYWIGMFAPSDTVVPDGFEYTDFPGGELGVCWIYGKEDEVYGLEGECGEKLEKEFKVNTDWCFERYVCPRFTTPDEKGNIILDICFFIN